MAMDKFNNQAAIPATAAAGRRQQDVGRGTGRAMVENTYEGLGFRVRGFEDLP